MEVTLLELYTLQMVSPSRLAALSTVSSGKFCSMLVGIVLSTMTCTYHAVMEVTDVSCIALGMRSTGR